MTTTAEPTLAQIAAELDQAVAAIAGHRRHISDSEAEHKRRIAESQAEIAGLEASVRTLVQRQHELTRAAFPGLFAEPEAKPKRRRSVNGNGTVDYTARTAKRLATLAANKEEAAARAFAKERGLHCPDDAPVPDEVMAAFRQEGGFQG